MPWREGKLSVCGGLCRVKNSESTERLVSNDVDLEIDHRVLDELKNNIRLHCM